MFSTEANVFPLHHLQPKRETQVDEFLAKHPEYDGRGVVIAILDTGVDPAALGLQKTSKGERKILDMMDCSGAGDVDTSTIRVPLNRGFVLGLTGRKLMIPETWTNPSNKYYLGVKPMYQLFPAFVLERIKKLRKDRCWSPNQRLTISDVHRQIEQHENEHGVNLDTQILKWDRENLTAQLEMLKAYDKDYEDCGPSIDCLVWNDGKTWRACLDTSLQGNLDKCTVLGGFKDTGDFGRISDDDMVSYAVNIHDNGKLLEIVACSGAHGTHVASISAACFPDEPCKNGVAPGAHIISMQIGDSRLCTMETGTALTRAINRCIELGVDVVNYSYGEAADWPNSGVINNALLKLVDKHGIAFVSSAGNNGPALSTTGCPGSTSDAAWGVGAYVSPEMMSSMYSLREQMPSMLYPWSSRGPTSDGSLGVCISAPGGAITSVPKWSLKGSQLQNGTSMSAPHTTGAVALLMSSLKCQSIRFSPYSIRLALENTAKRKEEHDVFSTGNGMLQVCSAHDYLISQSKNLPPKLIRFKVCVDGRHRGVYIRESFQHVHYKDVNISIEPEFKEEGDNEEKVSFELHCLLVCDANYVELPRHVELMNTCRQINVRINTAGLEKGKVHFTEIKGFDSTRPDLGPLWRVPITVIVPEDVQDVVHYKVERKGVYCKPGIYHRLFVTVPLGAEWAVLNLQSEHQESSHRFVLHTVQLLPQKSYSRHENYKLVTLSANGDTTQGFNVVGGRTMELCITKWWTSLGDTNVNYSLQFRGLAPVDRRTVMMCGDILKRIDVVSPLSYEELNPSISLKLHCLPLRPAESKLGPLGPRDLFEDGKQIYSLLLTYNLCISKSTEVTCTLSGLSEHLYESEIDCKLWMIFTQNKQYMFSGETYPIRYASKLEKGDYILKLQLRHEEESVLEKFKDMMAVVQMKLSAPITVEVYGSHEAAFSGKKFPISIVAPKSRVALYLGSVPEDKIPKNCTPGSFLSGALVLPKDEFGRKVNQWSFEYVIGEPAKKSTKGGGSEVSEKKDSKKTKEQEYFDALRDLKLQWVGRVNEEVRHDILEELEKDHAQHLPVYLTQIKTLIEKDVYKNRSKIIELSDLVISKINQDELLKFYGTKNSVIEAEQTSSTRKKIEMERQKLYLLEALIHKCTCLVDFLLAHSENAPESFKKGKIMKITSSPRKSVKEEDSLKSDNEDSLSTSASKDDLLDSPKLDMEEVDNEDEDTPPPLNHVMDIYAEITKFIDPADLKVVILSAKIAVAHEHYGRALKLLSKLGEDRASKENDNIIVQLCEKLGWFHIANHLKNWIIIRYPKNFRLF